MNTVIDTKIKIGSLVLKNPVTLASGTAGYGEELHEYIDLKEIGAIFTKGLSMEPRSGNRGNRICETPSGMLNSIGLENVGLKCFLDEKLPFLLSRGATPIPNIAGHSIEENLELCRVLSATPGIHALELNVSCPNVKLGGIAFGTDIRVFSGLVEKAREATECALIVKLSPNVTDITEFAIAAEKLGADAVSAVNTYLGMKIDINRGRPHFKNKVAGLSGPAIRPMAIRAVYQLFSAVRIPVIGMGGIASVEDMLEFIMAGASAVSIGTMNLINPKSGERLLEQYLQFMETKDLKSHRELIGIAHQENDN